jgi:RNA recognition motif-containing protein
METKLYVGNLTYNTTEADLQTMFAASGVVKSVQIIKDRDSGQSKGFGFVEMTTQEEAQNAIKALGGKDVGGRALTVNLARPREERGGRGGRGGGGRRDW